MGTYIKSSGFTLLEILIALVISATLAVIAIPMYGQYVEQARVSKAKVEIGAIAASISKYYSTYNTYPPTLAALGTPVPLDPWGNAYVYLPIAVVPAPNTGQVLKDKSLHPVNTDFDLYSKGPDGQTTTQIASKSTQDDIIRAGNGSYIGVAQDY